MLLLDIDQDSRQRTADRDESETVVDFTSIRRTTSKVCMEEKGKCSVWALVVVVKKRMLLSVNVSSQIEVSLLLPRAEACQLPA